MQTSRRGSNGVQSSLLRNRILMMSFHGRIHFPSGVPSKKVLPEEDAQKAEILAQAPTKDTCLGWHFRERCHLNCDVQRDHKATRYSDILSASLVPFLKKKYPRSHRLFRDNDPRHTSKYTQHFFDANGVNWW